MARVFAACPMYKGRVPFVSIVEQWRTVFAPASEQSKCFSAGLDEMAAGPLRIHQALSGLEFCFPRPSGVVLSRVLQLSL